MRTKDEAKLQALFDSTVDLVAESGLVGVNMAAVAKGAGLATGTTYRYFKGKDELLSGLYHRIKNRFSAEVFQGITPGPSLRSNLKQIWDNYLDFLINRQKESIFLQQFNHSPYIKQQDNLAFALKVMDPLFQLFREGEEKEIIRPDDQGLYFGLFASFLEQCAFKVTSSSEKDKEEIAATGFNLFWNAIKT